MGKRILVSLGGNALGTDFDGLLATSRTVAKPIAGLIQKGYEVVICHGNGPQVGIIKTSMDIGNAQTGKPGIPMSECVAMSQAFIGYHLQNALQNALKEVGVDKSVATVVTRVVVDRDDEGFQHPTKPVGAFVTYEQSKKMAAQGKTMIEDSGRGYREVVPSPLPQRIVEKEAIKQLLDGGSVVIAGGGGGIPVTYEQHQYRAIDAVIDKDWVSVMLAQDTACDSLVVLTGVEKVAVHFNKPDQRWLDSLTVSEARDYIAQGEFPPGSMLPKVEAAIRFTSSAKGCRTLITSLDKLEEGLAGQTGTWLVQDTE